MQPATKLVGRQPAGLPAAPAPPFEELYASQFPGLVVQLYAYFGDRQEALDVVQEAFCRALARWSTVSRYDDPVAWVRRVAPWPGSSASPIPRRKPMTEHLTDDPIRSAFAELQATEWGEIVPPGVGAAYRTVRRRRATAATSASLAGVAMLGGISLGLVPLGDGPPGPDPDAPTPAAPSPTSSQPARVDEILDRWDQQVYDETSDPELARIVHQAMGGDSLRAPGAGWSLGDVAAGEGIDGGNTMARGGRALNPGLPVTVRVACGGDAGTATFILQYGDREPAPTGPPVIVGGEERRLTVPCENTPDRVAAGIAETTIEATGADHWLEVFAEPDQAALADGRRPILADAVILQR